MRKERPAACLLRRLQPQSRYGVGRKVAWSIICDYLADLEDRLMAGETVRIPGICSIRAVDANLTTRDPRTGKPVIYSKRRTIRYHTTRPLLRRLRVK